MGKVIIIAGPTGSGKTRLALKLAQKYRSPLISCDSRQVYKYLDIITGKDLPQNFHFISDIDTAAAIDRGYYTNGTQTIYGLDIVTPDQEFTVKHYLEYTYQLLSNCFQNQQIPIIVGGTGFYLNALISPPDTLLIPPDPQLRAQLAHHDHPLLFQQLTELDPRRASQLNPSDKANPYRLIRAIEIAQYQQKKQNNPALKNIFIQKPQIHSLTIGIHTKDRNQLYKKIDHRVDQRLKQGALDEVTNLRSQGWLPYAPARTLGYRQLIPYLQGTCTLPQAITDWKHAEHAYARRQLTWFNRLSDIHWFDSDADQIESKISSWLSQS